MSEALRLAQWLDTQYDKTGNCEAAADELRRLHQQHTQAHQNAATMLGALTQISALTHLGGEVAEYEDVVEAVRRVHTENERLERENFSWRTKLGTRGYEIRIADLEAQRQALLEALNLMVAIHDEPAGFDGKWGKALDAAIDEQRKKIDTRLVKARAAIKAVEEQV